MTIIRVLSKYKGSPHALPDAEIFFESRVSKKIPFEKITLVNGKLIHKFVADWNIFVVRIQALKKISATDTKTDLEIIAKIKKKSTALSALMFPESNPFMDENELIRGGVTFITDPEFASIPFEILMVKDEFLYKKVRILRQIRSNTTNPSKRKGEGMLLISNPGEKTELYDSVRHESSEIYKVLKIKLKTDSIIHLKGRSASLNRFLEELPNVSYLHYAGHSEKTGIRFSEEEIITDQELGNLGLGNLKIVFFNSCFSAFHSNDVPGLPVSFLRSGAGHFIGYSQQVDTEVAKFIGVRFWEEILKGKSVSETIFRIRKDIEMKFGQGEIACFSICHFGPDSVSSKIRDYANALIIPIVAILGFFLGLFVWTFIFRENPAQEIVKENPSVVITQKNKIKRDKIPFKMNHPIKEIEKVKKKNEKSIESSISEVKLIILKKAMFKFLHEKHPLLSIQDRKNIIYDILSMEENDYFKYNKFIYESGISP